jgi:hypothetical protein
MPVAENPPCVRRRCRLQRIHLASGDDAGWGILCQSTILQLAKNKTHTPKYGECQVHPTASSGLPFHPNLNTIRFWFIPKVLPCPILKTRLSTPPKALGHRRTPGSQTMRRSSRGLEKSNPFRPIFPRQMAGWAPPSVAPNSMKIAVPQRPRNKTAVSRKAKIATSNLSRSKGQSNPRHNPINIPHPVDTIGQHPPQTPAP